MFKIMALVAVVLLAAVFIYASTRSDTFRVRRSASIKAPPEKIFPLISDLRRFNTWNPYEKKDPDMKRNYAGPPGGGGAVYEFDGDKNVGKGRIEITEASPPSKVTMRLDKPFEAHNIVEFTLQPAGDAPQVTWSLQGPLPFSAKVIHVFFNMDRMVGNDFETGLTYLKTIAEEREMRVP